MSFDPPLAPFARLLSSMTFRVAREGDALSVSPPRRWEPLALAALAIFFVFKENTFTFEQKIADGLLMREEWRRDASNHPYFLTDTLGRLKKEQNTATLGIVWWFGGKEGAW